jgi:hypothetical protein
MQNILKAKSRRFLAVLGIAAIIAAIGLSSLSCIIDAGGIDGGVTNVSFTGISANGNSSTSTTEITLRFDREIPGLRASDITVKDRSGTNRFNGTLSGSNPYYMSVSASETGNIEITVDKSGYDISPSTRTVYVYYVASYSLNGYWECSATMYINGSTGVITDLSKPLGTLWQSAVNKGYLKVGDTYIRNITKTGDRTWSCSHLSVLFYTDSPNVAIGTTWRNETITMSADGKSFLVVGGNNTWVKK